MRIPDQIDTLVLEDPDVSREHKFYEQIAAGPKGWQGHIDDGPPVVTAAQRKYELLLFLLWFGLTAITVLIFGPWALVAAPISCTGVMMLDNRLTLPRRQAQEQKARDHYLTVRRKVQIQLVARRSAENELRTLETGEHYQSPEELAAIYDLELDEATAELLAIRIREEIYTQAAQQKNRKASEQASQTKRDRIHRQLEQIRQEAPGIAAEAQKRFATEAERFDMELGALEEKE